jgi:hypothetical protein
MWLLSFSDLWEFLGDQLSVSGNSALLVEKSIVNGEEL